MTEYKIEKINATTPAAELQERLNRLAKEDWDLAGIDPRPHGRGAMYVFRREARETPKAVQGFAGLSVGKSPRPGNPKDSTGGRTSRSSS